MIRALLLFALLIVPLRAAPVDVLIAAATDAELQPLLSQLTEVRTETRAAWQSWSGQLGGQTVALTRTDGDPLNAVATLAVAHRTRNPMGRVFPGIIGSAHEVNLELDRVRWSAQTFGMDVEEMESGHVAALAHAYGIRYAAFRVVSDAPYEGVPLYAQAARATALFTVNFLHHFPALP